MDAPRSRCGDPAYTSTREWLVTNGTGSYASGTIDGQLTRSYHGLLVAALDPPAGRRMLVAKLADVATTRSGAFALTRDRWAGDAAPAAPLAALERFRLEGSVPVWSFALGDALLERRITMRRGLDVTVVRYTLVRSPDDVALEVRALGGDRDFGARERAVDGYVTDAPQRRAVRVRAPWSGSRATWIRASDGEIAPDCVWYRNYALAWEAARGLGDAEDHLHVATLRATLRPGASIEIEFASGDASGPPAGVALGEAFAARARDDEILLDAWRAAQPALAADAPAPIAALVLAADAFVVRRPLPDVPDGRAILAGYHWFGEWGRDCAIALPGLAITTGRIDVARAVLLTFGRHLDRGMLPNDFPNVGAPGYNSVDAPLWYVDAVRAFVDIAPSGDSAIPECARFVLAIADAFAAGTRYGIGVDPGDGLLRAGEPGVQLTWMDAKVDDWVVTPRIGKPVEINALWYNALCVARDLAPLAGRDGTPYGREAERVRQAFARFDGGHGGGLMDVLDGPGGDDPTLRPNQIFAASLLHSPVGPARRQTIVACCARELLTSHGLRSLAPSEPGYRGAYAGDRYARDGAYHEGTVWPWLLGPFAIAHFRAFGDRRSALAALEPLVAEMDALGCGTLAEIAQGDAPFAFDGAIAQAWSVAEVLRAWHLLAS